MNAFGKRAVFFFVVALGSMVLAVLVAEIVVAEVAGSTEVSASILLEAAARADDSFLRDARRLTIAETAATNWPTALSAIAAIESPRERRYAFVRLANTVAQAGDVAWTRRVLTRLVTEDATQQQEAGRLAATLLDAGGNHAEVAEFLAAWETPFASDAARYAYIERAPREVIETHLPLFERDDYRDWARLALAQKQAKAGEIEHALATLDLLSTAAKRAWGLVALGRLADAARVASAIDDAEQRAVLQRLLGRRLRSVPLLEASIASAAEVGSANRRDELQLFAARQLALAGEDAKAREIVRATAAAAKPPANSATAKQPSASRAMHSPSDVDTMRVVSARLAVAPLLGEPTVPLWERLLTLAAQSDDPSHFELYVARFFAARESGRQEVATTVASLHDTTTAVIGTNAPRRDQILLPPDEYEELYFSPLTIEGCGCD